MAERSLAVGVSYLGGVRGPPTGRSYEQELAETVAPAPTAGWPSSASL